MRKILYAALIALVVAGGWYAAWSMILASDVARVKASIDYHYQALRTQNRSVSLKADDISAAGFPFKFLVRVKGLTASMVEGSETFAVSIPVLTLSATDKDLGRYRVDLPHMFDALYAKDGAAPEHYVVTADQVPQLLVSAQDAKKQCGPLTGVRCEKVAADAPLISFAVKMPERIVLHMVLGAESKDATFNFTSLAVPIYWPIPSDISRPLYLSVGVLREALVYKGKW